MTDSYWRLTVLALFLALGCKGVPPGPLDEIVQRVVALLKYDLTPMAGAIVIERGDADELCDAVRLYLGRHP